MSERSKQLAQEFIAQREAVELSRKEQEDAVRVKNEKAILDARILKQEAPKIWAKLCSTLAERCDEVNKEPNVGKVLMVSQINSSQVLLYRAGNDQTPLRISFGVNDYTVRVGGVFAPALQDEISIKVLNGDSEPSIVVGDRGASVHLDDLVDSFIRAALGT